MPLSIEVPVARQESERLLILPLAMILIFDSRNVPTVTYFYFSFYSKV
jgi:hypothetical protein